ncbi:uncharacterized protein EI97DRAFT_430225 [Westerdykella ornata]|uniref:Acyl-CoA dehydrogenase/oxidase C-terminal domain-containing protein n=1 Tax=Westerdykella ornata TaxID=318751 RepID=A0A6A6JV74_WESOR|nr:uncharacterized protein EI97DRAFT_430225 [Westerdykella ornata]KAF2280521.1 hypothetical protein EI97DRAFT_430225 [Westerdykella ornata]
MASQPLTPSSSTTGFFQTLPVLPPQYTAPSSTTTTTNTNPLFTSDDKILDRILNLYLPSTSAAATTPVHQHLHRLARLSLHPSILKHSIDAETNLPFLRPLTTFGNENKTDPLVTAAGWTFLKQLGFKEGVVAVAYDPSIQTLNRRIYEFALGHIWTPTATMTGCPMAMTDGAAFLLSRHLDDADGDQPGRAAVFREAYRRLTSRDPAVAWTSGQWMTERTGGSDVSGTETVARRLSAQELREEEKAGRTQDAAGMPLGPWRIDGFKWFSSATDSEMAILLARTAKGGLSAFYAPMRRRTGERMASIDDDGGQGEGEGEGEFVTELNGVRIQRLKAKLGTRAVPTAELELCGLPAYLIGTEGQGVKEISAILNITRLSTAAGSIANWARGLAICRAYSRVRRVRGALLKDSPQHCQWMADETVRYYGAAHFAFLGVALLGATEQDWDKVVRDTPGASLIPREKATVGALLRLLTPVMKAQCSVSSVHGLRECMECLGGVGYCENNEDGGVLNVARVYRDNMVNPIWEGTVSVMAEDVVRVLMDRRVGKGDVVRSIFVPWVEGVLGAAAIGVGTQWREEEGFVRARLRRLGELTMGAGKAELLYRARDILRLLGVVTQAVLLICDAAVTGDEVAIEAARRWVRMAGSDMWRDYERSDETARMDRLIFLGEDDVEAAGKAKL